MSGYLRGWRTWLARLGPAALALSLSLAAGASPLVLETPYAPIGVVVAVVAAVAGAVLLFRPAAALYLAVFVRFLPLGLIDMDLQAMLGNLALLLALGAWLMQVIFGGRRVTMPLVAVLLISVILLHFVSVAWAPDLVLARQELVQWTIVLILLVLILNIVDTPERLDGLMAVIALNGWGLVLAGLFAALTGGYQVGERLKVLQMNENGYGIALLVGLTGVLWGALRPGGDGRRAWPALLGAAYIPLAGLLTIFTGSRGSTLSLAVICALFLLLGPTRRWGWYAALLGCAGLLAAPGLFLSVTNRLQNPAEDLSGDRTVLWEASAALIADHPWGVGAGYGPRALYPYILRRTSHYANRPDLPSHNPILEIGIDTGLAGMLLYCAMLALACWGFARRFWLLRAAGEPHWNSYFALVLAVMAGYTLSWFKSGGVYYNEVFILQLALLTLPACAPLFRARGDTERPEVQVL